MLGGIVKVTEVEVELTNCGYSGAMGFVAA